MYIVRFVTFARKKGHIASLILIGFLFAIGLLGVELFEPVDSSLRQFNIFAWWFVVTVTTVGYGDYSPVSDGARAVAVIVMLGGIGSAAFAITKAGDYFSGKMQRFLKGLVNHRVEDHIVIYGFEPKKTQQLVDEILADTKRKDRQIILCLSEDDFEENPMPGKVKLVRGNLRSDDVLNRACIYGAWAVVIDGKTDSDTISIALAVNKVSNGAHVIATYDDEDTIQSILQINDRIQCVLSQNIPLVVQELQDRGCAHLVNRLLSNQSGNEIYRIDIPRDAGTFTFEQLFLGLKRNNNATPVAVTSSHDVQGELFENPDLGRQVSGGQSLFVVAEDRITADEIDWTQLN